jgi:hypothetical protein
MKKRTKKEPGITGSMEYGWSGEKPFEFIILGQLKKFNDISKFLIGLRKLSINI